MTRKNLIFALLAFLFSTFTFQLSAQNFRAALTHFMHVPEGMEGGYVQMEQEIAKPIHQEMVNQGKYQSWALYAIPYPGGTGAEYHYATVHIYNDPAQMENPGDFGNVMEKVHSGKDLDKMSEWVMQTRDMVKTERFFSWERFSATDLEAPPTILQVVYFKVPMENWDAYQKMEREVYHPMHKKEIEMGGRAGWEGWWLQMPQGSGQPYTHVAVDFYKDWAQYTSPGQGDKILKEVHPGKSQEELTRQFVNTVDLVKIEEWRLVDYVVKQ